MENFKFFEDWLLEQNGGPCTRAHAETLADAPSTISYWLPTPTAKGPPLRHLLQSAHREELGAFERPAQGPVSEPIFPGHCALVRVITHGKHPARCQVSTVMLALAKLGLRAANEDHLATLAVTLKPWSDPLRATRIIRVAALGAHVKRRNDYYCGVWSNAPGEVEQPIRLHHFDRPDLELGSGWNTETLFLGVPAESA